MVVDMTLNGATRELTHFIYLMKDVSATVYNVIK
jgi:hypothetical protein